VTVAVIEPATLGVIEIPKQDLKVEWYSGTGAGGQHRNKHQNSCRLTHMPTGLTVTAQCRSRSNSWTQAISTLRERLNTEYKQQYNSMIAVDRRQQVGSGQRGDKIRTYRFQDDVVKDHVTNKSASVRRVLAGDFGLLW
jgi:peptide chain release factor 1